MYIEIRPNNVYVKEWCGICGDRIDAQSAYIVLNIGHQQQCQVCLECLLAGPQEAAMRAKQRAGELRQEADDFEALAGEVAAIPLDDWATKDEFERVRDETDRADRAAYMAEQGTAAGGLWQPPDVDNQSPDADEGGPGEEIPF
jgi:hypothetical protein